MSQKFVPWGETILVLPKEHPKETPGGIIIPDSATPHLSFGEVVAAGVELKATVVISTDETGNVSGQTVVFPSHAGVEIELDGKKHLLLKEEEVYGILKEV